MMILGSTGSGDAGRADSPGRVRSTQLSQLRVLILGGLRLPADAVRSLLRDCPDVEVVGAAASTEDAVRRCEQDRVDMVLIDVDLPTIECVDATRQILHAYSDIKILVLVPPDQLGLASRAIKAGAHGFVSKAESADRLIQAIRRVAAGQVVRSPDLPELSEALTALRADLLLLESLTRREIEVLKAMASCYSTTRLAAL